MWRVNKIGQEQVWYESEIIEKIKAICKNTCNYGDNCNGYHCYSCKCINEEAAINQILNLIKEVEK